MSKTTILKCVKIGVLGLLVADALGAFDKVGFDKDRFDECMRNTMEDNDFIDVEYYEE